MRNFLLAAILLMATRFAAPAMVFWNLGNDANQTDPGTGAPWSAVAKVVNSNVSLLSGSAIYLGGGYMLTANHVTMNTNEFSYVTFDGTNTFAIDPSYQSGSRQMGKQVTNAVATNVDMAVFKLLLHPTEITPVNLLATTNEAFGSSATIIGWGVGRYPGTPLESTNVPWDTNNASNTSAKRWGVNAPKAVGTNPYDFLVTVAGATGTNFDPDGLGDAEASVTLLDSGSGLFQEIGGDWYLIGLTTSTDGNNAAVYGNDATSGSHGDFDYFARISSYEQQIAALIPEPSTYALLALGTAAVGLAFLRRC